MDLTALFKIGYGLYVVTSNDGVKDNGLILNSIMQVTNTPNRIAVTINKSNYSHDVIQKSGKMNVNCLSEEAPFKVFEVFGFQSGRDVNKFADCSPARTAIPNSPNLPANSSHSPCGRKETVPLWCSPEKT